MGTLESNPQLNVGNHAPWLAFDAYVFDIDGTLLNSRDLVHYHAFQSALRDVYRCDRDITEVTLHGNTDPGILRATTRLGGISDADFDQHLPQALEHMRQSIQTNQDGFLAEVCPSIAKLLALLHGRGKLLGVATGNLEAVGWPKLASADLKQYFHFGSFSDRHELRSEIFRHAVQEARALRGPSTTVCFVGDTPTDIAAAKANDCPIIAVATGIHPLDELQALSPDFCVRCCDDLFPA